MFNQIMWIRPNTIFLFCMRNVIIQCHFLSRFKHSTIILFYCLAQFRGRYHLHFRDKAQQIAGQLVQIETAASKAQTLQPDNKDGSIWSQ